MSRESIQYDVVIVGAGPSGLAAAIRVKQLLPTCSVCVLEKANEVGGHILSGAVFETRALDELLPNWRALAAPLEIPVSQEQFLFLSKKKSYSVPQWLLPKALHNRGNYVISLAELCRFLARQANDLAVDIYPGFSASEVLFDEHNQVIGVVIGDKGVAQDGSKKPEFSEGLALHAKHTLFAEGCRGYLSQQLINIYGLQQGAPQTYGLGIKEIWQVDPLQHNPGKVLHTAGWPLQNDVYGGGFIYHLAQNKVAVGFVVGLDYHNTFLDPFKEMQRFKTHPDIAPLFAQGKRLAYGARTLNEGGFQAIPQLVFPGGMLIGCSAGFLNVAKAKGSHTAMKSGMLAAESVVQALQAEQVEATAYPLALKNSWVYAELYQTRNFRAWFRRYGLKLGTLFAGLELKLPKCLVFWTVSQRGKDRAATKPVAECLQIDYPKADGQISFDRAASVDLANIQHEENQPIHLRLKDPKQFAENLKMYAAPEQRYCPAGVYEVVDQALRIHASNCVQCKACDIKDPGGNIVWTVAEGGSGPNYQDM